ncbi:iron-sulfur cluster biosynthesis family protein [Saccharococcus caldoxylosilyticus]|uniref:Core domain-containing protein n=1 Tax=Parageobacillus caldoxylosilyticus NBRC 107762 TaxID=1220594 RepID=A0A023DDT5_9BACL|nr:iron-sulfur cluster biosynthesis family protein [Parageobacillus caldoxylosilyticus]MBB3852893.1 uncharacterized protein YqkB [Parageobacillus caldoxylosilyticus]QXJ39715.1 hypothetical protein BV455_03081 [Parageobacillus caldoxylosilyticus]BDG36681.1 hypothetical protein PcaKH15_25870 [Parageobacillus caldoxylosilyticus]BDG40469.1 hypothetical protein PcaKH16_26080 [Parageobacillus caldoxylosilyticus]BDG44221.1 hypothetical protein PcaKH35_25660 [Parageobacillus caldoxylosilyticus]
MNITFTEKAIQQLTPILTQSKRMLKLKYDTDGCGCLVDGVIALWLVDETDEDDLVIETNFVPILIEKSRLVFYDDVMTIDAGQGANVFQLKSPRQILNPRMALVEASEQHER